MKLRFLLATLILGGSNIASAEIMSESTTNINEVLGAGPDLAEPSKYNGSAESKVYDEPAFIDSSSDDGLSTAADVPISPYVIVGVDFDQANGAINGPTNTGSVPFTDNIAYFRLGMDKKIGSSWIIGGSIRQNSLFPVQAIREQNNSSTFPPSASSTEARIQAAYGTKFGLANVVRLDGLSGAYGAPGTVLNPTLRLEDFLRYTTQYSDKYYQFVGGRARIRSNETWDSRIFAGQGFRFNEYNYYEIGFIQDFSKLGYNSRGLQTAYSDGMPVGVVSRQLITNSYTLVFKNKMSLNFNANWVGSSYFTSNYQNGYELESSLRIPF
ncbi:MAG: hypothetical protein K2Y14_02245 [Burkholderiales bacterium]|nr:hypothetical protein [Burkholderiales bacterium]